MGMTTEESMSDPARSGLRPPRDRAGALVPLGHNHQLVIATYQTWAVTIPSQYSIEDLLDPSFWRNVELVLQARTGRPSPGDMIRCLAADGAFDAVFTIEAVERGYRLRFHHGRLPDEAA